MVNLQLWQNVKEVIVSEKYIKAITEIVEHDEELSFYDQAKLIQFLLLGMQIEC